MPFPSPQALGIEAASFASDSGNEFREMGLGFGDGNEFLFRPHFPTPFPDLVPSLASKDIAEARRRSRTPKRKGTKMLSC